jgi:hypothetical protein
MHQHNLISDLRRRCRQALLKLQQVFRGLGKGCSEEVLKHRELPLLDMGDMMKQGKHSLGHLLME